MKLSHDATLYLAGTIALIGIIGSAYLGMRSSDQQKEIESLLQERNAILQQNNQKSAELAAASTTISELRGELIDIGEELEDLADDYRDEKDRNEEFEDQIRHLAGTLGDLDKLAKTDEELLAKYSKVYFLNENYIPVKLKQIPDKYILPGKKDQYFHADAYPHLEDLMEAARKADIDLKIVSAYRSFDEQVDLKGQFTQVYGTGANAFSADQGYSEHQLGTAVDLTTPEIGGTYTSLKDTKAYEWLLDNAYKYGFILSYPEDNEFYVFEPWHWRFVGTELARYLHRSNDTFYTMDQREINEYLLNFFD
ncbi:D-alanyl-D-alanine carboxypeptidase family protein [Candidatus Nomurabacteria bacterium]|nr:D-alanyl-D-alanine carboxypeptidase family protein [Candidatus Nomurabacteria bacterium]